MGGAALGQVSMWTWSLRHWTVTSAQHHVVNASYCDFIAYSHKVSLHCLKELCLECSHEVSGEGLEEAVRKWMINPKTPKPHRAVLGEGVSWEIWNGLLWGIIHTGCCVSHEEGGLAHKGVLLLQHKQGHQIPSFQFFFTQLHPYLCSSKNFQVSPFSYLFFNGTGFTSVVWYIRSSRSWKS